MTQNRFSTVDEIVEVDSFGNTKVVEPTVVEPTTRREFRRIGQRQAAISPPSRRGHRENHKRDLTVQEEPKETLLPKPKEINFSKPKEKSSRGRQYDRHSGTGIHDNEKKINHGWGVAGQAEYEGIYDVIDPFEPITKETPETEEEMNVKTLDEYLEEKKSVQSLGINQIRKPNEGSDDTQWKNTIPFEKKEERLFGKH